jgi:hypothetical protein
VAAGGVRLTLATGAGLYAVCTLAGLLVLYPLARRRRAGEMLAIDAEPTLAIAVAYGATRRFDPAAALDAAAPPEPVVELAPPRR